VIGESGVDDASVLLCALEQIEHTEFTYPVPTHAVQVMNEVVVDVAGLEVFELGIENLVTVFGTVHGPVGQLGRKEHTLAQTVLFQQVADEWFTCAHVIRHGGVDVVHAAFDGTANLSLGALNVDFAVFLRQTHAAVPEDGELIAV
jgi:hypothetical protein